MERPDIKWYVAISQKMGGTPRCPFAAASRCPRYYESLRLLGEVGFSTKISEEDRIKLDERWHAYRATLGEEEASISGGDQRNTKAMSNFCPEVSYKIFDLFASGLYPHHGDIDVGHAHEKLRREGADLKDPRWRWCAVTPCHYTECSEYSILQRESEKPKANQIFNINNVNGPAGNIGTNEL